MDLLLRAGPPPLPALRCTAESGADGSPNRWGCGLGCTGSLSSLLLSFALHLSRRIPLNGHPHVASTCSPSLVSVRLGSFIYLFKCVVLVVLLVLFVLELLHPR